MKVPLPGIAPVEIALESIEAEGDLRFSGVDIESGARVTVMIARGDRRDPPFPEAETTLKGLVLVLTMQTIKGRQ
jgi:hypothetical protein